MVAYADYLTYVLRLFVRILLWGDNMDVLKASIEANGALDAGNLKAVYGLLDKFQLMTVDTVLYVLFYLWFGANNAVNNTNAALAEANKWLKTVSNDIANSDAKSLAIAKDKAKLLMEKYFKGIIEPENPNGPIAPNGLVRFFYAILNFFRRIFGMDPLPYPLPI